MSIEPGQPPSPAPRTKGELTIERLPWKNMGARAAVRTVVIPGSLVQPEWRFPILVRVVTDIADVHAWAWRDAHQLDSHGKPLSLPAGVIGLSAGLRRSLSRTGPLPSRVTLVFPESSFPRIIPALASEITEGAVIHIPVELSGSRRPPRFPALRSDWRLLVVDGICAPVRVRARAAAVKDPRCGMLLRTLLGVKEGDTVALAMITPADLRRELASRPKRRTTSTQASTRDATAVATRAFVAARTAASLVMRSVLKTARTLDFAVEAVLRVFLRAPAIVVRTTQAPVGEDATSVIRLHPAVFPSLGASPGTQVLITWCGLRVAALALEDYDPLTAGALSRVQTLQAVELTVWTLPELPPHLIAGLSVGARRQLGIPSQTVIEVRRRLRPMVVSQLNRLAVPVAGIYLAGVAVDALRGWPLAVGLTIAILFGLAPLRRARPPKGLWP